jgi:hypothetical protein
MAPYRFAFFLAGFLVVFLTTFLEVLALDVTFAFLTGLAFLVFLTFFDFGAAFAFLVAMLLLTATFADLRGALAALALALGLAERALLFVGLAGEAGFRAGGGASNLGAGISITSAADASTAGVATAVLASVAAGAVGSGFSAGFSVSSMFAIYPP